MEFEFALSGLQALEKLKNSHPPKFMYIFSDINMPGMSGLELLEKVKTEFPDIYVSMISAYGDDENHNRAMKSGASGFYIKPITFDTLKEEINQIIVQHKE